MAFIGSGAPLTNLNASNLSSGIVPTARLGTGTPSNSTFLRGDGSWNTPPSGGSIQATAAGSITAGRAVSLNANGTVSQPSGTYFSPEIQYNGSVSNNNGKSETTAQNATHVVYQSGNQISGYNKATRSNLTPISIDNQFEGSGDLVNPDQTVYLDWNPASNCFVCIYYYVRTNTNTDPSLMFRAFTFTVSGTTITRGSTHTIESSNRGSGFWSSFQTIKVSRNKNTGTYFVSYVANNTQSANNYSRARIVSLSGTTFTNGSAYTFPNANIYISQASMWVSDTRIVAPVINWTSGGATTWYVFDVSGTSLSLVSSSQSIVFSYFGLPDTNKYSFPIDGNKFPYSISGSVGSQKTISYLTMSGTTVNMVTENLPSDAALDFAGTCTFGVASNGIVGITFDSPVIRFGYKYAELQCTSGVWSFTLPSTDFIYYPQTSGAPYISPFLRIDDGLVSASYSLGASATNSVVTTPITSSAVGFSVGIATQSVSNGETVTVTVNGGVNNNQSGLSPRVTYYADGNGLITATAKGGKKIGIATSTTSILVGI